MGSQVLSRSGNGAKKRSMLRSLPCFGSSIWAHSKLRSSFGAQEVCEPRVMLTLPRGVRMKELMVAKCFGEDKCSV